MLCGMAKILDERVGVAGEHTLQIKSLDKRHLRRPASFVEGALADVVVVICAGKREAVCKQAVNQTPFPFIPARIIGLDECFICHVRTLRCKGAGCGSVHCSSACTTQVAPLYAESLQNASSCARAS